MFVVKGERLLIIIDYVKLMFVKICPEELINFIFKKNSKDRAINANIIIILKNYIYIYYIIRIIFIVTDTNNFNVT